MSVQMLATWGGYEQWSKQTLTSAEERRLITAGLARPWVGGDDPSASPVTPDSASGPVIFLGDSWYRQWNSGNGTNQIFRAADSSIAHACQLLNYGFPVRNAGVGANTSSMMLDRFESDVLAFKPRQVIIGATLNDATNDVPLSTSIANYTTMIKALLDRDIPTRLHTVPPTAAVAMNADRWALLLALNDWFNFTLPDLFPRLSIFDRFGACVDPVANPVTTLAGTYKDSLHYASALAFKIGKADAEWLSNFYAPGSFAAKSIGDNILNRAGSRVLNQYALFQGAGGTKDANTTGTVADGNRVQRNAGTGAGVASIVAHEAAGNWQQVAITGAGAADIWQCGLIAPIAGGVAGLVAGGSYYWECEVDVSGIVGVNEVYLSGTAVIDGTTYTFRDNSPNGGNQAGTTTPYRKMLRTEGFTIPPGAVALTSISHQVFCTFAAGIGAGTGAVVFKVGRLTPVALQPVALQ